MHNYTVWRCARMLHVMMCRVQLLAAWQQVKVDLLSSNVALITPTQLISLANIACGLPTNDIQSVPTNSYWCVLYTALHIFI
jgi:hypothetical protein